MKKKVALIIAGNGFQHIEYGIPKKMLHDAGYQVITASFQQGIAVAEDNSTTKVDIIVNEMKAKEYAGIFFIGGPGALDFLDNEISYELIQNAVHNDIVLGAICTAPRILAASGVLQDRKATGWDGDEQLSAIFTAHEVTYVAQDVVTDGLIVTAQGPAAAKMWAQEIIEVLKHQETIK